jgi:hypothetical protein
LDGLSFMSRSRSSQQSKLEWGAVEESSLAGVFVLPEKWPVGQPAMILENALEGGFVRFIAEPTHRLRVYVVETGSGTPRLRADVITCPILNDEDVLATFVASWKGLSARFRLNGTLIGSSDFFDDVPKEYIAKRGVYDPSKEPHDDLSAASAKKVEKRKKKYAQRKPNPARIAGTVDHLFEHLKTVLLQIADLLENLKRGETHHIGGLSAQIRLLIIRGEPLPLLQSCAAVYGLPLTVYTSARPRIKMPVIPATGMSTVMSAEPSILGSNPVDLDVWLHFIVGHIGKRSFTNFEILKDIGDTIGAHADHDIAPPVSMLRASRVGNGEAPLPLDLLGRYIQIVATGVLPLGRAIVAHHEKATSQGAPPPVP